MNPFNIFFPSKTQKYLKAKESGRQEILTALIQQKGVTIDYRAAASGGRLTAAAESGKPFLGGLLRAPQRPDAKWKALDLDSKTLDKIDQFDLMDLLADLSPEMSKAVWDFLRFCNAGWEIRAYRPSSRIRKTIDENGQVIDNRRRFPGAERAAQLIIQRLNELYGAADVLMNQTILSIFLRGSFLIEGVLAEDQRTTVDVAIVDPKAIQFKEDNDPLRGEIYRLGQFQNGNFVFLDEDPTICYVPLDPFPGKPPYGRAMASAGLFASMFLLRVLHDMLRVIQQQGYIRPDVSINAKEWQERQSATLRQDPTALGDAFAAHRKSIETIFKNLKPDDTFVHDDTVTINRALGSLDARAIGQVGQLLQALERFATRAFKTVSLNMGSVQSTSETQVRWEWHVYKRSIQSVQQRLSQGWGHLISNLLQAQGIIADVELAFVKIPTPDMSEIESEETNAPITDEEVENLVDTASQVLEIPGIETQRAA